MTNINSDNKIHDLIQESLNQLSIVQWSYNNNPALSPMLSTLNTIVDNIESLTEHHDVTLRWHDGMHYQFDENFDYDGVATFNISKKELTNLFSNPKKVK